MNRIDPPSASCPPFLSEGGEMGALMRAKDWSQTPLDSPQRWPQSLRTAVALMLRMRQPIFIGWGPEFISLYNDGYIPICGSKHPDGLGFKPDVVFLDLGLPGMDGYEVAKRMRQLPTGREMQIVAVSGHVRDEDRARAIESGCSAHLAKPFDIDALSTFVDGHRS